MGYKLGSAATDPNGTGSVIDPASCPTLPDKVGQVAAYGLMGYEIGAMTVRRASNNPVVGFFRSIKQTWDEPDWRKRAARRR